MAKARVRVKVDGLTSLKKKFKQMPAEVHEGAADAVAESAQAVEDRMVTAVPVDTGRLRESIGSDVDRKNLTAEVGTQGSGVHYAAFVEFGTSSMEAQPFATPAAEAERAYFPERLRRHVRDHLPTE